MPNSSGTSSVPTSRDQRDVVAQQVDDHPVLGLVLRIVGAGSASVSRILVAASCRAARCPSSDGSRSSPRRRSRRTVPASATGSPGRRDRPARRICTGWRATSASKADSGSPVQLRLDRKGQVRLVAVALRADAGAAGRSAARSRRKPSRRAAPKIGPFVGGRRRRGGRSSGGRVEDAEAPSAACAVCGEEAARASARADSRPRRRSSRPAICPAACACCSRLKRGQELLGRLRDDDARAAASNSTLVARRCRRGTGR